MRPDSLVAYMEMDTKKKYYEKVVYLDFVIEVSFTTNSALSLHSSADLTLLYPPARVPSTQHKSFPYPLTISGNPVGCSIAVMLQKVTSKTPMIHGYA